MPCLHLVHPPGKSVAGVATSGFSKDLVRSFAEKVVVGEALVSLKDVDVSFWAYWLATGGYNSPDGETDHAESPRARAIALRCIAV